MTGERHIAFLIVHHILRQTLQILQILEAVAPKTKANDVLWQRNWIEPNYIEIYISVYIQLYIMCV